MDAVDEVEGRLVLAEFSVEAASRYTFLWPRGDPKFPAQHLELLAGIAASFPQPIFSVAAWNHETTGTLRFRHLGVISKLQAAGWQVSAREGLGVATQLVSPTGIPNGADTATGLGVGWFLGFGPWCTAEALVQPPFLETLTYFGRNHRLAPSRAFLAGMTERGGAVAYAAAGDDRLPEVVLVASGRLRDRLEPLVSRAATT